MEKTLLGRLIFWGRAPFLQNAIVWKTRSLGNAFFGKYVFGENRFNPAREAHRAPTRPAPRGYPCSPARSPSAPGPPWLPSRPSPSPSYVRMFGDEAAENSLTHTFDTQLRHFGGGNKMYQKCIKSVSGFSAGRPPKILIHF